MSKGTSTTHLNEKLINFGHSLESVKKISEQVRKDKENVKDLPGRAEFPTRVILGSMTRSLLSLGEERHPKHVLITITIVHLRRSGSCKKAKAQRAKTKYKIQSGHSSEEHTPQVKAFQKRNGGCT